jgi:uncharacterized membrane protein
MEYKHQIPTLTDIREQKRPLRKHTRREFKVHFSGLEKFALGVTKKVGSMGFFFLLAFWTTGWLVWNIWGPREFRFDPAPAFVIWLFISNIIQLVLLPLIMVGQNLEAKFADLRAQADFEVDTMAEYEIDAILAHLENQNELLLELAKKIDRR